MALSSDTSQPSLAPAPVQQLCNMAELAIRLRTSRQTLSLWLRKWDDFPVLQRGTNGSPFVFDFAAVVSYLAEKKARQAREQTERDEALSQLLLPLDLFANTERPDSAGPSLKDQADALRLRRLQREELEASAELVRVGEISAALSNAFARWSRLQHIMIRQAARDAHLPDAVVRTLEQSLAGAQREFVREAGTYLLPQPRIDDARGVA